jgi:osmotically-inducible protein OsmY
MHWETHMTTNTVEPAADELQRRIQQALTSNDEHDDARVSVCVKGTCAVLKGAVHSWADHEAAERTALSIPGVTSVDNQLALLVKAKLATR